MPSDPEILLNSLLIKLTTLIVTLGQVKRKYFKVKSSHSLFLRFLLGNHTKSTRPLTTLW